jgi:hypothetical protein
MLTTEQEHALNQLLAHLPPRSSLHAPRSTPPLTPGFLQTWLGLPEQELQAKLLSLLNKKNRLEGQFLDWIEGNPLDSGFLFLGVCSAAFYQAEKDHNSRIETFVDAFYYIATCASVGYADIFAATQTGRAIAALVMVVGPAITNRALDRPAVTKPDA